MNYLKKLLCIVLCAVIAMFSLTCAYAVEDSLTYSLDSGVLIVSGYGDMQRTFMNDTTIKEVYIERGVTSVPDYAFRGCSNLEKATMSNSIVSVGVSAFEDCSSLSDLHLSKKTETIGEFAFYGCESLSKVMIPELTEEIYGYTFTNCTSLESLIIPVSVKNIDSKSFKGCSSLNRVYYTGSTSEWNDVTVSDDVISSKNIQFLSPEFSFEKTFSSGKLVMSLILESGSLNSLDVQFQPTGDVSIYRIQIGGTFTAASNKKTGLISLASDECVDIGEEVLKVTFNVNDCENYAVNIMFSSCAVTVEGYDVEVPVIYNGEYTVSGHAIEFYEVTSDPDMTGDGVAEGYCDCCDNTIIKPLTFAFKNCTVNGGILLLRSYGLTENSFREDYLNLDSPVIERHGNYISTDSHIDVDYSDGIEYSYDVSLLGDVDGDGFCDAQDSMIIMCLAENMLNQSNMSECAYLAADCTEDTLTDADDIVYAQMNGISVL